MLTAATQRRALSAQLRADGGVTLAELLVAIGLTMVIGLMATMFFITASHATDKSVLTIQDTSSARVVLDSWSDMVRVAGWLDVNTKNDRFEQITPNKIVFYANLGNRNDPATGAVIAGQSVDPVTKVALMLKPKDGSTDGQLIEVLFDSDNTTVKSIRRLAFDARPDTADGWIFSPIDRSGGPVDTSQSLCKSSTGGSVVGLCAKLPTGSGMRDPVVSDSGNSVNAGPLSGDGSANSILGNVGRIDISFVVRDPSGVQSSAFESSAAVNSGYST